MKLRDPADKLSFLCEVGRLDLLEKEIPDELFEVHIQQRKALVPKLKDMKKSQAQRANWRKHKRKILSGIKTWHKSTKGKKFHRQMGKFLSSRSVLPKSELFKNRRKARVIFGENRLDDFLTALSSARTHLYIDLGYYKTLDEEVMYSLLLDEVLPVLNSIESKIRHEEELDEDEYEILLRIIDSEVIEECFGVRVNEAQLAEEDYYLSRLVSKC